MNDAIRRFKVRRRDRLCKRLDAEWSEQDHPRDENGRFSSGGGGSKSGVGAKPVKVDVKKPVKVENYSFKNYKNPDGKNMPGCETIKGALEWMSKETERQKDRVLKNYSGGTPPSKQLRTEFGEHINRHSAVRDIALEGAQQGVKDCKSAIIARQNEIMDEFKDYTVWDSNAKAWTKPKK